MCKCFFGLVVGHKAFNLKLILLFDRSDYEQSVIEWIEKAEWIYQLSSVKCVECGSNVSIGWYIYGVPAVEGDKEVILPVLKHLVYSICSGLYYSLLHPTYAQERLDGFFFFFLVFFLPDLHKLAILVSGMMDWSLMYMFITRLPEHAEPLPS